MQEDKRIYQVRSTQSRTLAVACGIQSGLWGTMAYGHYQSWVGGWAGPESIGFTSFMALFMLAFAIAAVWQSQRPAYMLHLGEKGIKLRRRELLGDGIKRIYISWEDNPSISIKPKGSLIVPNDLSFRFQEGTENERRVSELVNWAESRKVPIIRRKATRWV
ncbi:hypothetical protein [Saccharibacillus sacchari]|uniref:Uncharacterized protein n=1 Tax=Saccharibacillus sacchari TaxID=456493 RepID=A0ACC6P615_9BACL